MRAGYSSQKDAESGVDALRRRTAEELGIPLSDLEEQASAQEIATNHNTDSLDENTTALADVNKQLATMQEWPTFSFNLPTNPDGINPTAEYQQKSLDDGMNRAKAARLAQGVKGYSQEMSGAVPESTMTPPPPAKALDGVNLLTGAVEGKPYKLPLVELIETLVSQYRGGAVPIEGGVPIDITLNGVPVEGQPETWPIDITPPHPLMREEDLPEDLPTISGKWPSLADLADLFMGGSEPIQGGRPAINAGTAYNAAINAWGIDLSGTDLDKTNAQKAKAEWEREMIALYGQPQILAQPPARKGPSPKAIYEAQRAAQETTAASALTTGGMVPIGDGYAPLVGMPNPAGMIDLLIGGAKTFAATVDQLVHDAQPLAGPTVAPTVPSTLDGPVSVTDVGPLTRLVDYFLNGAEYGPAAPEKSARPTANGPQDMVSGLTVYTPWEASPAEQPPLPPVDAQGYGRPLIPGLDTPPGLTSGHMAGDTVSTPAPFVDIQPADIFPGWMVGTAPMPDDFKLFLPLVPNQAALDEALGKQPEQISTRILDRIGSGLEGGASLLNPLVNAWGIDLSDDGLKQLDPLADRVSGWFNDRLFSNLGKPDGDFVGAIVAKVLEALTAE